MKWLGWVLFSPGPNLLYFGWGKWLATSAFFEEGKFEKQFLMDKFGIGQEFLQGKSPMIK